MALTLTAVQATTTALPVTTAITTTAITTTSATTAATVATLARYGLTTADAAQWIMGNLHNVPLIYTTAKTFGLSDSNLSDILQSVLPGLKASDVTQFFTAQGVHTATQQLAGLNTTVPAAADQLMAAVNQGGAQAAFNLVKSLGLDHFMLVDVLASALPGLTPTDITAYFTGITGTTNPNQPTQPNQPAPNGPQFPIAQTPLAPSGARDLVYPDLIPALSKVLSLNTQEGLLSTESIRATVLKMGVSQSTYDSLFSPATYGLNATNTALSSLASATGLSGLTASSSTLESLLYGTMVKAYKAIDTVETQSLDAFFNANLPGILAGSEPAKQALLKLATDAFTTPTNTPHLSDQEVLNMAATTATDALWLMGQDGKMVLFDSLFSGLIPYGN